MTGNSNKYNPEKLNNTKYSTYPGSVDFYHTRPGNGVGLFYSARAHPGREKGYNIAKYNNI